MLNLNPLFPMYFEKNGDFRMGNLPKTGKIIKNPPTYFKSFIDFLNIKGGKEYSQCLNFLVRNHLSLENAESFVQTLISSKIIVDTDKLSFSLTDNNVDRQQLFFSFFSEFDESKNMQIHLENKKILLLGLGAIGSTILNSLVRVGVKNFILVDYDAVEKTNLRRQNLFTIDDVGKYKVDVLKKKTLKIYKDKSLDIQTSKEDINQIDSYKDKWGNIDLVICTADYPANQIRSRVNKICVRERVPLLFSGFSEYLGIVGPLIIPYKTACWDCIYKEDANIESLNINRIAPSFGPLCETIGSMASLEVVKFLTGFSKTCLWGKELFYDPITQKNSLHNLSKLERCDTCGQKK